MRAPYGAGLQPPGLRGGRSGGRPGGAGGGPRGGGGLLRLASSARCLASSATCCPNSRPCWPGGPVAPGGPGGGAAAGFFGSLGSLSLSFLSVSDGFAGAGAGCAGLGSGILRTISSGTFASGSTMTRIVTSRSSRFGAGDVCANAIGRLSTSTNPRRRTNRMMPLLVMQCHPLSATCIATLTRRVRPSCSITATTRPSPGERATTGSDNRFAPCVSEASHSISCSSS